MIRAAGILILDTEGKALFLKRGPGSDYPGAWCVPGGRIEDGEEAIDAAIRECEEETGYKAPKAKLTLWTRSVTSRAPVIPAAPPTTTASIVDQTITKQLQAHMEASIAPPVPLEVAEQVDFSTFVLTGVKQFSPVLGPVDAPEHTGFAWAPINDAPQPLHPGVQVALDRFNLDELGVARAMAEGRLTSPQRYENVWLFEMRITGTGVSYRLAHNEFVIRDKSFYLNDEFLARCNGLPVILQHPKKILLDSKEFSDRIVGTIMLPFIKGEEVWGIAKIFDDKTAELMQTEQVSTSPAVNWRNPDANNKVELEDGNKLLIEGKPSLLDHLAICPLGVWDKGGKPTGVTSIETRGDSVMKLKRIEGETDESYNARVAEATALSRGDAIDPLQQVLGGINALTEAVKSVTGDLSKLTGRMDAFDKRADAAARCDAFEFTKRGDAESEDDFKSRMDSDEEKLRADMEEAGKDKAAAKADARSRRDEFEKGAKADSDDDKDKKDDDKDKKADEDEKKDDKRGDATPAAFADLQKQLDTLKGMIPRHTSDADHAKFLHVQARADAVEARFGRQASRPMQGETLDDYRRRLLNPLQMHHPDWSKANLLIAAADSAVLDVAEKQIYEAADLVSRSPATVPPGTLREINTKTRAGHPVVEFAGEPKAWMGAFMPTGRAVTKIVLNKGN